MEGKEGMERRSGKRDRGTGVRMGSSMTFIQHNNRAGTIHQTHDSIQCDSLMSRFDSI